jgi:hypothetical protein
MSGRGWHILREEGGALTLCRRLPPRFDVMAETDLPGGSALRLAHQIRQDMWRALRHVRGFHPVVRLTPVGQGWRVAAGGGLPGPVAPGLPGRIGDLLAAPAARARWLRCAGYRAEGGA